MKKFLLGLLCGLVLAVLFGVILIFSAVRLANTRPMIASNSLLVLRLEGDVPEKAPVEIPLPAFEEQSHLTVRDVWSGLRRAADDSRIKGVLLVPRRMDIGWAKMQQIRDSLVGFRRSGKPVYALLRFPGTHEYYIATAADKIYAGPEDYLDLKGLRIESMFLKGSLDKLGIQMDVIHAGKYKDAGDIFTRTSMSPETREVMNQILDDYYGNLTQTIAAGRKKDAGAVRALIDQGPFISKDAMKDGLIDALGYEDQAVADLESRVKQSSLKKMELRDYLHGLTPDPGRTKIALLVAEGTISQGTSEPAFGGEQGIKSGSFTKIVQRLKSDSTIKGVILRVDSPGGDAIASDDILHAMKELSRAKPVVISMSDLAASGGYFISVTGDPIVASANTLTGSIGVITAKPNIHGLYDKLGISKDILTRGRFAAIDSDYRPLGDAEKAKIDQSVEATYRGFIDRVAAGRHKTFDQVAAIAQGRVWPGVQAKDNGLVDQLGGLDTAVDMMRQRAKLSATEKIDLVPYPPRRSLFELLMSRADDSAAAEVQVNAVLSRIPGGMWLRPALEGGLLALMPYSIEVR